MAALEALKLQLQCFPVGSAQQTFALQSLAGMTSSSMDLAGGGTIAAFAGTIN